MPLVTIDTMKDLWSAAEKRLLIEKVTDAIVEVAGEPLRATVQVRLTETEQGQWAIGGQLIFAWKVRPTQGQVEST